MITCSFEDGGKTYLRHVVLHAILEKEGELLLVKRDGPVLDTGKWSLPAGYLDRDETVTQGVIREVKEETGWDAEIISLFRINSNPDRPHEDRQNVALDFILRPIAQTGQPDKENSKIEWIAIDDLLPFEDFAFDHGETIKLYLKYRKKSFPLPILL